MSYYFASIWAHNGKDECRKRSSRTTNNLFNKTSPNAKTKELNYQISFDLLCLSEFKMHNMIKQQQKKNDSPTHISQNEINNDSPVSVNKCTSL